MHLQKENRELLGAILGFIIIIASGAVFGYILYKNWDLLNINIILSVIGGMLILAGTVLFMIWPKTYFPALLILVGLTEQAIMLLIFLDIKFKYGGMMMIGLSVLIIFCILGIIQQKLHLSDEELAKLEPVQWEFKTYEYHDPRYNVQDPVAAKLMKEREEEEAAKVVDIKTAQKPPMAG